MSIAEKKDVDAQDDNGKFNLAVPSTPQLATKVPMGGIYPITDNTLASKLRHAIVYIL